MVFSSLSFITFFLPAVLVLYLLGDLIDRKINTNIVKNTILVVMSLIFYGWGEPKYILIMIFSTIVDFIHGQVVEKNKNKGRNKIAKAALISSVVINLSLLAYFKYAQMLIDGINAMLGVELNIGKVLLPIGISFYTFQTMSYTIDVYRGNVKACRNIIDFAMYVCMFPQLIAGPIVRYVTISEEIKSRRLSVEDFSAGVGRFIVGMSKKLLLANNAGMIWTHVTESDFSELTFLSAWVGILAFSFQIYFDFSGYSDMAIGIGRMLGFHFDENFNYPYISKSVSEFWRRWHMSLGTWFKEYVYIPLGGNRKGIFRTIINLLILWGLTGLWHGAAPNFLLWGLYYGVLLIIEKLLNDRKNKKLKTEDRVSKTDKSGNKDNANGNGRNELILSSSDENGYITEFKEPYIRRLKPMEFIKNAGSHLYTIIAVVFGWLLFEVGSLKKIADYSLAMLGTHGLVDNMSKYEALQNFILFLILTVCSLPVVPWAKKELSYVYERYFVACEVAKNVIYLVLFGICIAFMVAETYNPFLYFRF